MIQPKISVVTVCYNTVNDIEKTILSVINQTYPNIEYLIIDGGSKDGTMDIVNKYKDKIDVIVSEPDKGIYDAMNKGIKAAAGEWINFMNAGDLFVKNTTLSEVFKAKQYSCDVIYGDTIKILSTGAYWSKHEPVDTLKTRLPFCHQSCFISKNAAMSNLYNTDYKIAADYNQFYTIYKNGGRFKDISVPISIFDNVEGLSSQYPDRLIKEYCRINESNAIPKLMKLSFVSIVKRILQLVLSSRSYEMIMEKRKLKKVGERYEL